MMRAGRLVSLVLGALLFTSGCGLSLHNLPIGRSPDGPTYRINAVFGDAANLPVGGEVKIGQALVGRVNSVSAEKFQAVVRLEIREEITLPTGTTARLEPTSALGEEYVLLHTPNRPDSAKLSDGATIPRSDTTRGPDAEQTLAALGAMLSGSGLDQARTIVSEMNTVFAGREHKIRDLLHRLDSTLATFQQHTKDFDEAIDSLHRLSAVAAENKSVLQDAMTEVRPSIDVLLAEKERFSTLLTRVSELGRAANGVVEQAAPEFLHQLDQIRPILNSLSGFDHRLGNTLTALKTFEGRLSSSIPGDYLNMDADLDLTGTVQGILPGAPPPPVTGPGGVGGLLSGGTR